MVFEILDRDLNSKAIKILGFDESTEFRLLCVMGKFIIFHYGDNSGKYLEKFDKDLVGLKRIPLQYEICDLQATKNLIYALLNCEIRVLNEELITLQVLGQTECPNVFFDNR